MHILHRYVWLFLMSEVLSSCLFASKEVSVETIYISIISFTEQFEKAFRASQESPPKATSQPLKDRPNQIPAVLISVILEISLVIMRDFTQY